MYNTNLTDAEWEIIQPFVTKDKPIGRPSRIDRRRIIDAIMYQNRTGCQWRLLPKDFPNQRTICHYYYRWLYNGTWERIHNELVVKCRTALGKKRRQTDSRNN